MRRLIICVVVSLPLVVACAANIHGANLKRDVAVADSEAQSKCMLPSKVATVNCFDAVERPIWQRDDPDMLYLYNEIAAKRLVLAQQYDKERAPAEQQLVARMNAARAELHKRIPQLDKKSPIFANAQSPIMRELAVVDASCHGKIWPSMVDWVTCDESAERPVIEREVPQSMKYFDAFSAERLDAAKARDADLALITPVAAAHYKIAIEATLKDSIAKQQAARQAANAQQARNVTSDVLEVVGAVAIIGLEVIAVAAQARSNNDAAISQSFQQNRSTGLLCFGKGEQVSGLNKVCFYDCAGSGAAITIKSYQLCPLNINQ